MIITALSLSLARVRRNRWDSVYNTIVTCDNFPLEPQHCQNSNITSIHLHFTVFPPPIESSLMTSNRKRLDESIRAINRRVPIDPLNQWTLCLLNGITRDRFWLPVHRLRSRSPRTTSKRSKAH